MDETGDEWTDDDENEKLVKKANRVPLLELKDLIQSLVPSLSLTATNGYGTLAVYSNSGTRTPYHCMIPKRSPKLYFKHVSILWTAISSACIH